MVDWYDAVEKGDALRYGGYQDLALNKLDALSYSDDWNGDLKICTAYQDADGNLHYHVPRDDAFRKTLKPVYKTIPGWAEDIAHIRHFDDLLENAKRYIAWMPKSLTDVANYGDTHKNLYPNLRYIGVGPEPNQIIKDAPEIQSILKLAQ